jgi:hypothetical protein
MHVTETMPVDTKLLETTTKEVHSISFKTNPPGPAVTISTEVTRHIKPAKP